MGFIESTFKSAFDRIATWGTLDRDIGIMLLGVILGFLISLIYSWSMTRKRNLKMKKFYKPYEGKFISKSKQGNNLYSCIEITFSNNKFLISGTPLNDKSTDFYGEVSMDDIITTRGSGSYKHKKGPGGYIGNGKWEFDIDADDTNTILVTTSYNHTKGNYIISEVWQRLDKDESKLSLSELKKIYYKPLEKW